MSRKQSIIESDLYRRCDEVLHYVWDPIGVAGHPGARDEYQSYLPGIFGLVLKQESAGKIADHLVEIEKTSMGLTPGRDNALKAATNLLEWKEWLDEFAT